MVKMKDRLWEVDCLYFCIIQYTIKTVSYYWVRPRIGIFRQKRRPYLQTDYIRSIYYRDKGKRFLHSVVTSVKTVVKSKMYPVIYFGNKLPQDYHFL